MMNTEKVKWSLLLIVSLLTLLLGFSAGARPHKLATFAGGNFWCMEEPFEEMDGIFDVVTGYIGGTRPNPTHEQVASGATSYVMAVQVSFDPEEVSYSELLDVFWRQVNPTDGNGQFSDRGRQYRTAIFTHNSTQQRMANEAKSNMQTSGVFGHPIVTEVSSAGPFKKALRVHQNYYKSSPAAYRAYREKSGRDEYLKHIWGRVQLGF